MKWIVRPSELSGTIIIPPSKSHTIRALLISTLADGVSTVRKPLLKGDGASAIGAARAFGARIEHTEEKLTVNGIGDDFNRGADLIDMGNSGTGLNLFSSAAALGERMRRFDGDRSLRSRPVKPLLKALSELGAEVSHLNTPQDVPFSIKGPLRGGSASVDGINSQFVSSLLFTCPLIQNDTDLSIFNLHEQPYIELTLWWLRKQGIEVSYSEDFTSFHIQGRQKYHSFDLTVPADFSSATFSAVAGATGNSCIGLSGLDFSDPQGDKGIFEVLSAMGAVVEHGDGNVKVSSHKLHGSTFDLNRMPDALPALSVAAAAAEGETVFTNVAQARIKETDRIKVMSEELAKMGIETEEYPDGMKIRGGKLKGAHVNGHDDHRVVMALALAGMIADGETVIDTAEAAEVTYPSFVEDFRTLGACIEVIEE
ncbi:MAG: 3-phosphoshikimate 1-carboxyvinyltransferase [Chitinispirillaceae bacterium]